MMMSDGQPEGPKDGGNNGRPAPDFNVANNDFTRMNESVARELQIKKTASKQDEQDRLQAEKDLLAQLRPQRVADLKKYLTEYWQLKKEDEGKLDRIQFVEAINLSPQYKKAYDFMHDDRLSGTMIAIVPDDMWGTKSQPSESDAGNDVILFKAGYFKGNDDIGWMAHELGHCQRNKQKPQDYDKDSGTRAFSSSDFDRDAVYPNNKVEAHAFLRQFQYLKEKGINREEITAMLKQEYKDPNDFRFFGKLLDQAFKP